MRYGEQIVKHRLIVSLICLCVLAALIAGVTRLRFDASYTAYFDPSDPHIPVYNSVNMRYDLNDNVVVILHNLQGTMLDTHSWQFLSELTQRLAKLPYVIRSQSASNILMGQAADSETPALHYKPTGKVQPLTVDLPRNKVAGANEGLFLSQDRNYALINLVYALPANQKPVDLLDTFQQLRASVDSAIGQSTLNISTHYTGTLALNEAYITVVKHDLRVFFPGLLLAFLACLYFFYRSVRITVVILLVALLAAAAAFGAAGWIGFPLASIHTFVPVIIATISIAGSVHLVTSLFDIASTEKNHAARLIHVLSLNLLPITLTCATTALGFLALMFSPSPPVQRVGYIVAMGVFVAWTLNLSLLLALLPNQLQKDGLKNRLVVNMQPFIRLSARYGKLLLVIFAALGLLAIFGVSKSTINDNVFAYFDESSQFSQDTALAEQHFSGVQELAFEITALPDTTVLNDDYRRKLRATSDWLATQPSVIRIVTFDEFLPETILNNDLISSDAKKLSIWWHHHAPKSLAQFVSKDLHASRLVVYLDNLDATELIEFDTQARKQIDAVFTPEFVKGGTGTSLLFALLGKRNARSMVLSLGTALILISVLIGVIAKSVRIVWVSLICNILPVAVVYAMWTLLGGYISLGGAIVMGMILGIVVDDTIFLLNRYIHLKKTGSSTAIQKAILKVGPALMITSTTLCVGLGLGMLSDFLPIFTMSILSVSIIALAFFADVLLLPALLLSGSTNNTLSPRLQTSKEQ